MKALVTGGGGFVGKRIVRFLRDRGHAVSAFGRHRYPELEEMGAVSIMGDVRDAESIRNACKDMDVVLHAAAVAEIWGRRKLFWDINVEGTKNVLSACKHNGVPRLVFTSSPSVVFGLDGSTRHATEGGYPESHLAHYPATKAEAERLVLRANGPDLATVSIRPHLIWGPGDPHLIPRILYRAKHGKLVRVGDGSNLVDVTYVDNAAIAHVQAMDALEPGVSWSGRAYFVSQGEPVRLWEWINNVLERLGLPQATEWVTYRHAYRIGAFSEAMGWLFRREQEPQMTRFVAAQLSHSHHFGIREAREAFGYHPIVSMEEGLDRLVEYFKDRWPQ